MKKGCAGKILAAASLITLIAGLGLTAGAQTLDWNRDPLPQFQGALKAQRPANTAAIPVAHQAGAGQTTPPDSAQLKIYATGNSFPMMISVVDGEPAGKVALTIQKDGHLGALFTDAAGDSLSYTFYPDLTVSGGKILYRGAAIGDVAGNPAQPKLDAGYELKYEYGGIIDVGTGADRVFVFVFLARTAG